MGTANYPRELRQRADRLWTTPSALLFRSTTSHARPLGNAAGLRAPTRSRDVPGPFKFNLSGIPNGAQEDRAVWNRGRFGVARCHASAVHDFHGLNVVRDDGVGLAYPDIADQNESRRGRPLRHRPPRRPGDHEMA